MQGQADRVTTSAPDRPSSAATTIGVGSAHAWLLATRPKTLLVGVTPILLGAAAALHHGSGVNWLAVLAALFGAVMIQIGANLANDVFDHEKGADTEERIGPLRVTQAGLLTPRQVRGGMVACFAAAFLVGIYLTAIAGWPIVVIGLASIASGIAYTGGPYPLGYNGLGDIFVMLFFGPVAVCGTMFVACGVFTPVSLVASLACGALATAVLAVNNVRDVFTDTKTGKRTLAVRFGRRFGVFEYAALVAIAEAVPVVLVVGFGVHYAALAALFTAPLGIKLAVTLAKNRDGAILNAALADTAKLLLVHGVLLSVGIALAGRS